MKKVMDEIHKAGNVVLFIDELHTLIGAGGAEGAIDASNILNLHSHAEKFSASVQRHWMNSENTLKKMQRSNAVSSRSWSKSRMQTMRY